MGYAVKIYSAFKDLGEEKARILAEFAEYVESQKAATSEELKGTELRLQKEIELVRKELKETELRLRKEIEQVRLEVEQVKTKIEETKAGLIKWMFVFWVGQVAAIASLIKWFLIH